MSQLAPAVGTPNQPNADHQWMSKHVQSTIILQITTVEYAHMHAFGGLHQWQLPVVVEDKRVIFLQTRGQSGLHDKSVGALNILRLVRG